MTVEQAVRYLFIALIAVIAVLLFLYIFDRLTVDDAEAHVTGAMARFRFEPQTYPSGGFRIG